MIAIVWSQGRAHRRFRVGWFAARALLVATVLMASSLRAAETGADLAKFAVIAPFSNLVAEAQARNIPLSGADPVGEPGVLNAGDSFTAIVTLCEKGGKRTQWLLYLRALPADATITITNAPDKPRKPMVLYSGRSNRFEFASSRAPVRLETLGPFTAKSSKAKDQSESFALDKGLLSLGLDHAAATVHRAIEGKETGRFWFGRGPPDAKGIAEACRVAERLHLTIEEERALAGGIPAMLSYFDVVQHTEGLEDILLKVIRKPSLWSVIRNVGVTFGMRVDVKNMVPADPKPWGSLAGSNSQMYYFPLMVDLNQQLALKVTFVVTNPRPPLLACGGIIGMLAEKPGDNETYVTLRIVSARLATQK
jgi:hypothetical protein